MKEYDHRDSRENERIQRMKDRRAMMWRMEEDDEEEEFETVQRKSSIEIGASDDIHEQQADEVAKKVVAGENASDLVKNQPSINSVPQRKEEEEESTLMAKSEDGTLKGTDQLQAKLDSSKGGGNTLDTKTQSEMGEKMGTDLSDVKIHTDSNAHEMSEGINAKAFTHGQDVYFKQGNFDTTSTEGKSLLAHEIAHTQQQKDGLSRQIQRAPNKYKKGENLQSIWFKDIEELESAFDGKLVFGLGASGLYVQRVQLALLELQRIMGWKDETGKKFAVDLGTKGDDGNFGDNTLASMIAVQKKLDMKGTEGNVGKETMGKLDSIFWNKRDLPVSYNQLKEEEEIHQAISKTEYYSEGKIGATLSTYNDIAATGKNIYNLPSGKETFKILYGETVSIYSYFDEWYQIGYNGKLGWVQKDYVKDPMPLDDRNATLYFVQSGETVSEIAGKHYASIDESSNDIRLLTYAIANANVGRTGVTINIDKGKDSLNGFEALLLDDNSEQAQAIWRTIQVKEGTNIWLPTMGKIYDMQREGLISSGSMTDDVIEDLEVLMYFIIGFFEGVLQSIIDLFVSLFELAKLVFKGVELFSSPIELTKMWVFIKTLTWDEVVEAIQAIPGALWSDFTGRWNSPVRTEAAEFRGKVIGYIVAEIILAILTASIFTEVKWISFVLAKLGKSGEILLKIINGTRKVLGKETKAAKYAEELARLEEAAALKKTTVITQRIVSQETKDIVSSVFTNPNKVNKIINGSANTNHYWELLSPNKVPAEIADVIGEVLEYGTEASYKGVSSKVLQVTRNGITKTVQVPYIIQKGVITFGDAWVIP